MGKPLVPAVDRRTDAGESQGWSSFIVNGVNAVEAVVNAPSEYSLTLKGFDKTMRRPKFYINLIILCKFGYTEKAFCEFRNNENIRQAQIM